MKNFLFLQNMIEAVDDSSKEEVDTSKARKKILEIEREKAILAYRQLQARKRESSLYK